MLTEIDSSTDLATILNAPPATEQDAAETPADWPGIGLIGRDGVIHTYDLDKAITTATFAALADGTAAARLEAGRWVPDRDEWIDSDLDAAVVRDFRRVETSQGSFREETVHDTIEQANAAYLSEIAEMEKLRDLPEYQQ